jgi:hypothetical protein
MAANTSKRITNTAARAKGQSSRTYAGTADTLIGRASHNGQKTAVINNRSRQISGG